MIRLHDVNSIEKHHPSQRRRPGGFPRRAVCCRTLMWVTAGEAGLFRRTEETYSGGQQGLELQVSTRQIG